jgi:hypothetical protein
MLPARITPVSSFYPRRSFSAALLELGLRYQVQGLVRRAEELRFEAMTHGESRKATAHYREADTAFDPERAPRRFVLRA